MFGRGPWLGQVPLVSKPSLGYAKTPAPGDSLREGEEIPANGGWIVKRIGFLWFFPDKEVLDKIEVATGERPSESIEARVRFCNPTPGIMAVLGDFQDPSTGLWCFVDLPEGWNRAWRGW